MGNARYKDLTGQKFNKLLVVSKSESKSPRGVIWNCLCDCGGTKEVCSIDLKTNNVKSCGCLSEVGLKVGHEKQKVKGILVACINCNLIFKVKPSYKEKCKLISCSINCREAYLKAHPEQRASFKNRTPVEKFFDEKLTRLKMSAKKRGIDFGECLTRECLLDLWNKQEGRCFYSGVKLSLNPEDKTTLLSVDRKDNNVGYIQENIVLCTYIFNSFKFNFTHEEVINFVKVIKEGDVPCLNSM